VTYTRLRIERESLRGVFLDLCEAGLARLRAVDRRQQMRHSEHFVSAGKLRLQLDNTVH
jgi:hypothetical protein